ncbi:MAG TPA: pyrimidine dimer DNA glycosylase/endonuclease V [Thermoanaerobaculia bacterium]|nr:pyrimidine dimer DNA glycosylase/endonuclease V [Thermoanaerobaculia bacterium]
MRLWTVHPKYLDAKGLVAAWRESLLAQKVLRGETRGYRNHPQLDRFRAHSDPLAMAAAFLRPLHAEALARGYRFDQSKIAAATGCGAVAETEGQLLFEWGHLLAKLAVRAPERWRDLRSIERPDPHPLFTIVPGEKRDWEKAAGSI